MGVKMSKTGSANAGWSGLSKVMKVFFIISLALNLLVIGAFATAWHRHGGRHGHGGIERSLMHFAHTLPGARRRELRQILRKEIGQLKPLYGDLRAGRKAVAEALSAPSFDRTALHSALDAMTAKRSKVRERALQAFLNTVEQLNPEEKRAFGAFIKKRAERHRWRRGHRRWRHRE